LIIENFDINNSRKACGGVILTLKSQGPSKPKQIIKFDPCFHGMNHPEANGNFLKFCCRKLQVMIDDEPSTQHYTNCL
jgi:hypothetical protein